MKHFQCSNCGQVIEVPKGVPKPPSCPKCGAPATVIHRLDKGTPGKKGAEDLHGNALHHNYPFLTLISSLDLMM
jgi:NAD-dependent SIR2 family protein deacetylase